MAGSRRRWAWYQLDTRWARRLVAEAGVGAGSLVVDVGAGAGAITAALIAAGAKVIAVEAHPGRAHELGDRFGDSIVVVQADARDLLATLREGGHDLDLSELGDRLMLPSDLELRSLSEIDRTFGAGFGADVAALETGRWQGPIASGYGLHLVLVTAREQGRLPDLEEVRAAVERDCLAARRACPSPCSRR